MKIATWNVNSLKVRLPQLLDWLAVRQPDVVCLQETKCEDQNFPAEAIRAAGYDVAYTGQKTYNGVAILSRAPASGFVTAIPDFADEQKRVLAASIADVRVVCAYVPNGESVESPKYQYKLAWLSAFRQWIATEAAAHPRMVVLGDFNIAPDDRDVYDPKAWAGQVLCSEPEREALQALLAIGFKDSLRLVDDSPARYTWWDYRMNGFKRNLGLRIDHILASAALAEVCQACDIDREMRANERPSDHAPVVASFDV